MAIQLPQPLTKGLERARSALPIGKKRDTQARSIHFSRRIDNAFHLNGNVRSIEPLKGSLTVDTNVAHVTLSAPVRIGNRRKQVMTPNVVVKYLPDSDTPPNRDSILAMQREGHFYKHPRLDPLHKRMIAANVIQTRTSDGQRVPAILMPYVSGTIPLRQGLKEGIFTAEDAIAIQREALGLTIAAAKKREIRSPSLKQKMEVVSMKRLERERIWADMETAVKAIETFYADRIPQGVLQDAELSFAQKDPTTGEITWVNYPSLNVMQQRLNEFLQQPPAIMVEGVDHDLSMKNAEVFYDPTHPNDNRAEFLNGQVPENVRIDKGYAARMRTPIDRMLRRKGEVVDLFEAIFTATKAVSLETLDQLGNIDVAYVQDITEPHKGRLFIDATALSFSPQAIKTEQAMRSDWPQYARDLQFPGAVKYLEQWEAVSDFYEFVYAGKRVSEVLENGNKVSRPDAGLLMLQRLGDALNRADAVSQTDSLGMDRRRRKLRTIA